MGPATSFLPSLVRIGLLLMMDEDRYQLFVDDKLVFETHVNEGQGQAPQTAS